MRTLLAGLDPARLPACAVLLGTVPGRSWPAGHAGAERALDGAYMVAPQSAVYASAPAVGGL